MALVQGVTVQLTLGVVKNIIPAIASTNAIVAAACTLEALKLVTMCSTGLDNYMMCASPCDLCPMYSAYCNLSCPMGCACTSSGLLQPHLHRLSFLQHRARRLR